MIETMAETLNKMFRHLLIFLLPSLCFAATPKPRQRCRFGDSCWPDEETWQSFNDSISGHLIRTFPSAAVCHGQTYDLEECNEAKAEWNSSFWRTNQTGAYTAIVWELGNQQCFINSSRSAPCQPGLGKSGSMRDDVQIVDPDVHVSPTLFCCSKLSRRYSGCGRFCQRERSLPRGEEYWA